MCRKKGYICIQKKEKGLGCFPCGYSKVRCSFVAATMGALVRAAGDQIGTLQGLLHKDFCTWAIKWERELEQRALINQEYIKVIIKMSKVFPEVWDKVVDIWN
jgi:hypothetical protein